MTKRMLKRAGLLMTSALGSRLETQKQRRWLCDRVAPLLLDDQVLPHRFVERSLREPEVRVLCNPYVYTHRAPYWCGVLYEEDVQQFLCRMLRPGDSFIDVGANLGHVSIPAAALVGPRGSVVAFEPNPYYASLVKRCAADQGLTNLTLFPMGLGDESGYFTLQIDPRNPGGATLRDLQGDQSIDPHRFTRRVDCTIGVGDEVLETTSLTGRVGLKIDVEGFELRVLRGLRRTLRQRVDYAIIEVSPQWIGGESGVAEVFALFNDAGLLAHQLTSDGTPGERLSPAMINEQVNVVFCRDQKA